MGSTSGAVVGVTGSAAREQTGCCSTLIWMMEAQWGHRLGGELYTPGGTHSPQSIANHLLALSEVTWQTSEQEENHFSPPATQTCEVKSDAKGRAGTGEGFAACERAGGARRDPRHEPIALLPPPVCQGKHAPALFAGNSGQSRDAQTPEPYRALLAILRAAYKQLGTSPVPALSISYC